MDLYLILGLGRTATTGDVKRAYKRLARKYHPDINPGDRTSAAQFRRIADAYETLSDPDRRRRYDATGESTIHDDAVSVGFEGFDFSVSVSGSAASTFGDLFADVFSHGMLVMAYLGQALTDAVAPSRIRSFSTRFVAITQLGAKLTCDGTVTELLEEAGERRARLALTAKDHAGEIKLAGEAIIAL